MRKFLAIVSMIIFGLFVLTSCRESQYNPDIDVINPDTIIYSVPTIEWLYYIYHPLLTHEVMGVFFYNTFFFI